jgi:hypothetical protein
MGTSESDDGDGDGKITKTGEQGKIMQVTKQQWRESCIKNKTKFDSPQ